MKSIYFAFLLFLASSTSALDIAPGTYAISVVGDNACLGSFLAYDKGAGTSVYLIPSDTSQPPLWNVNPGPGGTFLLGPVNRTIPTFAPEMLAYNIVSCSEATVSLNYNPNATWANAGGFLNAAKRECPPGSAVTLAPLKTTGAGSCRAVGLVPTTAKPDTSATTWHFTKYPAAPMQLYTKYYGKPIDQWAPSVDMESNLIVEGSYYSIVPQPTYWQRNASGIWRRGTISLPTTAIDILNVAIGGSFVAVSVPVSGAKPKKPFWRVYVYDKTKIGGAPTATLTAAGAVGNLGVYLAAGADNLVVSNYPNKTFIFTRSKAGKWGAPVTLNTPKSASMMQMSSDGLTLAMSVFGEEKDDDLGGTTPISNGKVLVFKQAKAGAPWTQQADLQPPKSYGILTMNPEFALAGDNLAVSYHGNKTNLNFYRRGSSGAWKLVQTVTPPCEIFGMAADGDTVVAICPYETYQAFVYKRNKATGKWSGGQPRPLPKWNDDFLKGSMALRSYGKIALSGKQLAITAAFINQERSSPGVTFIYDNIDKL